MSSLRLTTRQPALSIERVKTFRHAVVVLAVALGLLLSSVPADAAQASTNSDRDASQLRRDRGCC